MEYDGEVFNYEEYQKAKAKAKEAISEIEELSWEKIEKGIDTINKLVPKLKKLKGLLFDD